MNDATQKPEDVSFEAEQGFRFDLAGRVRNLSLPASQGNALIPLFEAVSNALHAVESRFGATAAKDGVLTVRVLRRDRKKDANIISFQVEDNGLGLNDENMNSFRTSDSSHKAAKGGKGVGRLTWLKTFNHCKIVSVFDKDDVTHERSFEFSLRGKEPISGHTVIQHEPHRDVGTTVNLMFYASNYEVFCPKKTETIASKIVGHFLSYFVLDAVPTLTLEDGDDIIDLRDFYLENQQKNDAAVIKVVTGSGEADAAEFEMYHILLKKQLRFLESGGMHWIFQAGNERVVKQETVDNQLGLKYVGPEADCVYVGLVKGPFLDTHVNQERTGFTFENEIAVSIHKAAIDSAKSFLSEYINVIRARQIGVAERVIHSNPQFLPFREDLENFVVSNLSLATQSEEDIYVELSRRKLRAKRRLNSEIRSLKEGRGELLESNVQRVSKALNEEKRGSLAEYVVRRKEILELLDSSLSYQDPEHRKYFKEEVIHDLIIPLRSSSEDLDYNDHNLWILDDRLAFYSFFRSDKPFNSFVEGINSGREPDIAAVFERSLAFQREGRDEPVIVVEFKRPGRNDYDGNSSPVAQVLEYVDLFRLGTAVTDKRGKVIKPISMTTRFICFVVADFTETLKRVVRSSPANNATADGQGYFGYSREHNATIEVLPYEKLLSDARVRNEAFFSQLGLI